MALWQLECYLIQNDKVKFFDETKLFDSVENENLLNWDTSKINFSAFEKISKVLPKTKSWSENIQQFGNIDSTCIELIKSGDDWSIFVRIDLSSKDIEVIKEIQSFIINNEAKIVYNNKCYSTDKEEFVKLLRVSKAGKLCNNLNEIIDSL